MARVRAWPRGSIRQVREVGGLGFILRALGSCSESKQKGKRRMSSSHRLLVEELAEV